MGMHVIELLNAYGLEKILAVISSLVFSIGDKEFETRCSFEANAPSAPCSECGNCLTRSPL